MAQLLPCPVCGATLQHLAARPHIDWHTATGTLAGFTAADALSRLLFLFDDPAAADDDDAPTSKLPPVRETVLRRPPVPEVRELRGSELLRALADELAALDDTERDQ